MSSEILLLKRVLKRLESIEDEVKSISRKLDNK